jgi:O-antigen/teichoic acid export membrane protein
VRPRKSETVLVGVGAVVSGLGGFGFTWAVARGAGVAGAGVVLTLTTWFTLLAGITKLGMDTTLVREGGRIRAGEASTGVRALLPWTLLPPIAVSVVMAGTIALAAPFLSTRVLPGSTATLTWLIMFGAVALPAAVGTIVALALLRGLGRIRPYVLIEQISKPGGRTLAALALLALGLTAASSYLVVWVALVWLGAALTGLVLHRRLRDERRDSLSAVDRRRIWRYSSARGVAQIADLVNLSLGIIVLGALAGAEAAGAYAAAFRIVLAGQLVFQAARLLLAPSLAAMLAARRISDADETFATGTTLIVVGAWPLFLLCLVLPEQMLSLFGPGFTQAASTLQVLSISGLLLAVVGTQGSVILMSGRSGYALLATCAGLAVNAVLTLALLRDVGPLSAAIGWTAGILVEGVVLGLALRSLGVTALPRQALLSAALTAATLGVGLVLFRVSVVDHALLGWAALTVSVVLWLLICGPGGLRAFHTLTRQK